MKVAFFDNFIIKLFNFLFSCHKSHFHARKISIRKKINKIISVERKYKKIFQKILEYKVTL